VRDNKKSKIQNEIIWFDHFILFKCLTYFARPSMLDNRICFFKFKQPVWVLTYSDSGI